MEWNAYCVTVEYSHISVPLDIAWIIACNLIDFSENNKLCSQSAMCFHNNFNALNSNICVLCYHLIHTPLTG